MTRTFGLLIVAATFLGLLQGCGSDNSVADLEEPAAGEGFHFETSSFEVPPGAEIQNCFFFQVPDDGADSTYVNTIEVAMNKGSHHMNIFRVRTIKELDPENGLVQEARDGEGECFRSSNWSDWPLVINSQSDETVSWTLPEGVAHNFEPGEWLMLQSHYVNATTQKTPENGHVEVNFYSVPGENVTDELGTLFATKQSIRICKSNPAPTFEGTCQFNSDTPIQVIGANAHFHSRGTVFDMYSWDGTSTSTPAESTRFYQSTDWDHPPMDRSPDLNLTVPAKGGIWYTCSYEWEEPPEDVGCEGIDSFDSSVYNTPDDQLDCCYTFGGVVEQSEHCNIFVYYYPKKDDIACF